MDFAEVQCQGQVVFHTVFELHVALGHEVCTIAESKHIMARGIAKWTLEGDMLVLTRFRNEESCEVVRGCYCLRCLRDMYMHSRHWVLRAVSNFLWMKLNPIDRERLRLNCSNVF